LSSESHSAFPPYGERTNNSRLHFLLMRMIRLAMQ
jgi:hypothetical protein